MFPLITYFTIFALVVKTDLISRYRLSDRFPHP